MFPVINIGPLAIQSFGLILLLGVWGGLAWSEKLASRHAINGDDLYALVFLFAGGAVIGARLGYVAMNASLFSGHWLDVLSLSLQMMDWPSGLLIALIAVVIYIQRKKIPALSLLDSLVPFFLTMNIAAALATAANQTWIGSPSALPWAMLVYDDYRHPVQIYHLVMALVLLLISWPVSNQWLGMSREENDPGLEISVFLMAFGIGLAVVQTFRLDYPTIVMNINTYHLVGLVLFITGMWINRKATPMAAQGGL